MIGNDCTGSCKFNYHTTTTVQVQLRWKVIVLLVLMEFMIITVYKLSFHINQWKELVCWKPRFFVGVHWMEFADTTLGISEQYLFFCAQIKLLTSISSILLNQPPMDTCWISYCLHDWQTIFTILFSSFWTLDR